jgi:DNA-binding transcriptional regulator YhcF (GntR family)
MKRMMVVVLIGLVLLAAAAAVQAGRGEGRSRAFGNLSDEQRQAVHEKISEMKDSGASREEIHAAVRGMLEGWGVAIPDRPEGRRSRDAREGERPRHARFNGQLTEEQREAVHAKVMEMNKAGASREEIREAVHGMLNQWGIDVPEGREMRPGNGRAIFKQLDKEQRAAIHEKVREMKNAGASREAIHAAVSEMLRSFGIEVPEGDDGAAAPETLKGSKVEPATWGEIKGSFE